MCYEYRPYPRPVLEARAADYVARKGEYSVIPKVNIELMVESAGFYIWHVPKMPPRLEAFIMSKEGYIAIRECVGPGKAHHELCDWRRYRFNLAEELAHSLIHLPRLRGKTQAQIREWLSKLNPSEYRAFEREAKYVASAILMPARHFHNYYTDISKNFPIGRYKAGRERESKIFHELADLFDVNVTCIAIRAEVLGIVKKEVSQKFYA